MAPTVVVCGLNDKAKALVPRKSEEAPSVFVLNSNDFINLQRYPYAGMELPSTASLCEAVFPEICFKADMTLYEVRAPPLFP